jgi:hypothetical protein
MSPLAITRNLDRIRQLRKTEREAQHDAVLRQTRAELDRLARATAKALRQSDYWAEPVKESYLAELETR